LEAGVEAHWEFHREVVAKRKARERDRKLLAQAGGEKEGE
jgi:hypothetical protein